MYNDIIIENFSSPTYNGSLENPDFFLEVGNSVCGDKVRIELTTENHQVIAAAFRAWGCATSIATANIFCTAIVDQTIHGLISRTASCYTDLLGDLSPSQHHCLHIMESLHVDLVKYLKTGEAING